jgi:hypothetical protein
LEYWDVKLVKIILSRKGFDSGTGGCASPIIDGTRLVSFPIPDGRSLYRYDDLNVIDDFSNMVQDLSGARVIGRNLVHLDPDLEVATLKRAEGWKPAFGQTGAAQSHLEAQGVDVGDIFVFFGWFRDVERVAGGRWSFTKGGRSIHAIFGWLQVGAIVPLRNGRKDEWTEYPWLADHPHVHRTADPRNVIYVASDELMLPGVEFTGLKGGGSVLTLNEQRTLTDPTSRNRSTWRLPLWFKQADGQSPLSYHASQDRWTEAGDAAQLQSVARGQEFVLDCENRPQAPDWIMKLLSDGR